MGDLFSVSWNNPPDLSNKLKGYWDTITNFTKSLKDGVQSWWKQFTGQTSKELADRNFDMQQEQFDYTKALNQTQMEREDTAYQRAVADARAAGLSALSVGSGASASALNAGTAPQINDYASDKFNQGLNLVNTLTQFSNNLVQNVLQTRKQEADIAKINAETQNLIDRNNEYQLYKDIRFDIFNRDYKNIIKRDAFNDKYNFFDGMDIFKQYAQLNNLSPAQYSDIILENQFSTLGQIFGLISQIGDKFSNGQINSSKDVIDKLGSTFSFLNPLTISANVSNNKITTKKPNLLNYLLHNPFNTEWNKISNSAQSLQDSLESIDTRDNTGNSKKFHKSGKIK